MLAASFEVDTVPPNIVVRLGLSSRARDDTLIRSGFGGPQAVPGVRPGQEVLWKWMGCRRLVVQAMTHDNPDIISIYDLCSGYDEQVELKYYTRMWALAVVICVYRP